MEISSEFVGCLRDRVAAAVGEWRPGARVAELSPMTGGSSSLTFRAVLDGVPRDETVVVIKVAPPGLPPVRNRDVLRQARLQAGLQRHVGRRLAPAVLFTDAGDPPDDPPFMAMELVPGECVEPSLAPALDRPAPEATRARYLDAAELLAELHRVDPLTAGLGDEPVVTIADESERWTRAFTTVPDELREGYEACAELLHATVPPALPAVVNHGDYRLGNTLCLGEEVQAIIDWEIWSVGDPRIDLTWFGFFTDEAAHPSAEPVGPAGTPTRAEVMEAYVAAGGQKLPDLDWFHALTLYKEAAATALLLKRKLKAGAPLSESDERMLPALRTMMDEAVGIGRGRS